MSTREESNIPIIEENEPKEEHPEESPTGNPESTEKKPEIINKEEEEEDEPKEEDKSEEVKVKTISVNDIKFNTYDLNEEYEELLKYLNIKKLDDKEKLFRLQNRMSKGQFQIFLNDYREALESEDIDCNEVIFRYMKQFGKLFRLCERNLNLKKFGFDIDIEHHYGILFDKDGIIYHFLPNDIQKGNKEYDREISSHDWQQPSNINNKKPYFTLLTHDEINEFCSKWEEKIKFDVENYNTNNLFPFLLAYWLVI